MMSEACLSTARSRLYGTKGRLMPRHHAIQLPGSWIQGMLPLRGKDPRATSTHMLRHAVAGPPRTSVAAAATSLLAARPSQPFRGVAVLASSSSSSRRRTGPSHAALAQEQQRQQQRQQQQPVGFVEQRRSFFGFSPSSTKKTGRVKAPIPSRPPMRPGKVSPRQPVPDHVPKPAYADTGKLPSPSPSILLHSPESIVKMRDAGRLARRMLDYACSLAKPGVTTDEIDAKVHAAIVAAGAYPSPLNYFGFPKSICASVNEVVIHGIPDDRPLSDGDIAKFDVSLYYNGVHGDNCASVAVGDVDPEGLRLMEAAQKALDAGVAACRPGGCVSRIGGAIHDVADAYGYETVRAYSGHGIGPDLHMRPYVLHYRNREEIPLRPGMVFTIEPMILEEGPDIDTWSDGWTVVSRDGGRGAQYEHTVLITEDGVEILTLPE